jgi:phosphoenolpyruvate synthase/pyruvate phosphate dikinase
LRKLRLNILWLGDSTSFDVAMVGGKAANLSCLARMSHRVPDGFCIPVTVMDTAHPRELRGSERRLPPLMTVASAAANAGEIEPSILHAYG